jgi:hypothetical protein
VAGEPAEASKQVGGCLQTVFSARRSGGIRLGARGSLRAGASAGLPRVGAVQLAVVRGAGGLPR